MSASSWRTFAGARVKVFALAGSYAEKRASGELRAADRIAASLEELLDPPRDRRGAMVVIYLTDPVPELPPGAAGHRSGSQAPPEETGEAAIVRVVQPDAPEEPVAEPLTRALVERWFGPSAAAPTALLTGIAGLVAARARIGAPLEETQDWLRSQLASGYSLSAFAVDGEGPVSQATGRQAATSFVAFLIERFGDRSLREFLTAYDPERRDQAALAAFQRPLGALEESWLAGLEKGPRHGDAFRTLFRRLGPLLRPYWLRQVETLVYMLLGLSYVLALPLAAKYLVDTVIPGGERRDLLLFVVLLLVVYGLNALITMRRAYVTAWVSEGILIRLQEQMFAALQWLPHEFYARAKVGDLMSRLSNDLNVISLAMSQVVGVGIFQALTVLAAGITVVVLSPLLGAMILVTIPLFAAAYFLLRSRFQRASYEVQTLTGAASAEAEENLSAHAVIKAYGLEKRALESYHARLMALLRAYLRLVTVMALFETSVGFAIALSQLLVLGLGGYLVIEGELTIGALVAFIGLLPSLVQPIALLSNVGQTVQRAAGALERVDELLTEPVTIADRPEAIVLSPLAEEVRLEDVTFGYSDGRPVLRDLSMAIEAGRHTAIVGPSGSGKTSVLNLLMRFWDPQDGSVVFDGHDVRNVTLASLRGQVGIVFQDTFVFDTTVRENIALGGTDATDADVAEAARAAELEAFIDSLPGGFDTMLGERGVRMSGGQRQRLAIARALVREPRILVLDEATSALDAQTERGILDTLAEVSRGRTTISITHRLSLAATADRIVVLDRGRLVEEGTHAELLAAGGLYRRLHDEQTGHLLAAARPGAGVGAEQLAAVPLFGTLDSEALAALAGRLIRERYDPGVDIVRQGDPGDAFYVVGEGRLDVVVQHTTEERRVNVLEEGDYFGELALLSREPRTATVRTTAPTEVYRLARADFLSLLEQDEEVRTRIAETVAGRRAAVLEVAKVAPVR